MRGLDQRRCAARGAVGSRSGAGGCGISHPAAAPPAAFGPTAPCARAAGAELPLTRAPVLPAALLQWEKEEILLTRDIQACARQVVSDGTAMEIAPQSNHK